MIFGVVNAVVRPVVKLLSLPFIVLTLGLLMLRDQRPDADAHQRGSSEQLGLGFHVDGFWTAVRRRDLIITIVSWGLDAASCRG